jgi:hypothetical protein
MRANSIGDTGLSVRRSKPAFPIQPHHHRNDDLWPLLSRAWVYQERRLSSSVIHLARDQLYWECQTCFISEDGRESNFRGAGLKQGPIFSDSAWRHAVNHYSLLDITHDSDRLPAISAIVQRLQSVRKDDTYVEHVDEDPPPGLELAHSMGTGKTTTGCKVPHLVMDLRESRHRFL